MKLLTIYPDPNKNEAFKNNPACEVILPMQMKFYEKIGFKEPWIGYFAEEDGKIVGSGGFKGGPKNGKVEIAYGTFSAFQNQGIGTKVCRELVLLAQKADPSVRITARTLPEPNFSTKILQNNNFTLMGTVFDEEDGDVWEWELIR